MPLVGMIAKKKDIQIIKKELQGTGLEIIEITVESIKNIKNVKFEQIIFLEDLKVSEETYKYIKEIISSAKYIILNGDIEINILKEINIKKPVKVITFGFNSKSTITISSVKDEKTIVYFQQEVEKTNGDIIEIQEKDINIEKNNNKKIYNKLAIFIIKELHNL